MGRSKNLTDRVAVFFCSSLLLNVLALPTVSWSGEGAEVAVKSGDTNGDGTRDVTDAIYLLQYLFLAGPPPTETNLCEMGPPPGPDGFRCGPRNGDVGGDGKINLSDAIALLKYLFANGQPPLPCLCIQGPNDQ